MTNVCVVLGSVREGRMGLRIARYTLMNEQDRELMTMVIIIITITIIINTINITRMITKQLEKDGARPTLLDPLEIGAPLLAQPLHFMVCLILRFVQTVLTWLQN